MSEMNERNVLRWLRQTQKSKTNKMGFNKDKSNLQKITKYRMGEIWPRVLPVKKTRTVYLDHLVRTGHSASQEAGQV